MAHPELIEDFAKELDGNVAYMDDVYWAWRIVREPFTWQLFFDWWVTRRWVMPRDVRRR